ncbi:MAG: hypothetical protein PHQ42_05165 [Patescibacteria group bacterium]|nr:hypothetical protein [Patescibacteria group bacterium]
MRPDNLAKIKKLERQLTVGVILLFVSIIGFLAIYDLGPGQEALAITGNYNKNNTDNNSLNFNDWNNLPNDFLAKSGGTMTNTLTVQGASGQTGLIMKLTSADNHNSPLIKFDSTSATGVSNVWWMRQEGNMWVLKTSPSDLSTAITAIRSNAAGNVGIGTVSSPTEKLQVEGDIKLGGQEGNIKDVNAIIGYNDLFLKSNLSETAPIYIGGSQVNFYTNRTERMRITPAGEVGIGVTNPQATLEVGGSGIRLGGKTRNKWAPDINTYTVKVGDTNKNVGVHDVCLSAGMNFYDSVNQGGGGTEGCKIYKQGNSWLVQIFDTGECYIICLDW